MQRDSRLTSEANSPQPAAPSTYDVVIRFEGTVTQIIPLSDAALSWLRDNTQHEPWQWFGNTLVVESRFAADVALGMIAAGLRVR